MAIPTNYTNETFSDWLQDQLLLDTAQELGWLDIVNHVPAHTGTLTLLATSDAGTSTLTVVPLVEDIPAGTTITNGGQTGDVAVFTPAGSTTVTLTAPHANQWTTGTVFSFDVDEVLAVRNPIYESIIDEILARLAITDITTLTTPAQIRKLRIFARREVWRFAMQSLAADYDYNSGAELVLRSQVYEHARTLFEQENFRVRQLYTDPDRRGDSLSLPIRRTMSEKIIVRW